VSELHGWGRYPRVAGTLTAPASPSGWTQALQEQAPFIARGLGRSYGDSAIGPRVLATRWLDRFHSFDPVTGVLACDAGVSLDQIVQLAVPQGWFLPVTPGTRFVTVGGAIASDVHGKDHHANGTFCAHLLHLDILLGDGQRVRASPDLHADLFHATCGGMGLTGVVLAAALQLRRIGSSSIMQTTLKLPSLGALLEAFDAEAKSSYSVAWIDCMSTGSRSGRSLLMLGEHAPQGPLEPPHGRVRRVPFDMPQVLLQSTTARAFNALHYARAPRGRSNRQVSLAAFFYPLDALDQWNRLYGKSGFVQYQCVVPRGAGARALPELLACIAQSGRGSFLAVLKKLGPANANLLSFPFEGYTLALDFRAEPAVFCLLDRLDAMVAHHGGRLYLAKDARMGVERFRQGYPRWQEFEETRARWHAHGRFASAQSRRLGLQ